MVQLNFRFPTVHIPIPRLHGEGKAFLRIYLLLILVFACGAFLFHTQQSKTLTDRERNELNSVAALKAIHLSNWIDSLRDDARAFGDNQFVAEAAQRWLDAGMPDDGNRQELGKWLSGLRTTYSYQNLLLLSPDLAPVLWTSANRPELVPEETALAEQALRDGKVLLSDLFLSRGSPCLTLAAPLMATIEGAQQKAVTIVLARIDPETFLYPLMRSWPSPSLSAETILVRSDGYSTTYLNDLRFRPGLALAPRLPQDKLTLPSALIFNSGHDFFESIDYRGTPVLAVMREIPKVSWMMISKIDIDEFRAPQRRRDLMITLIALAMIIASGLALWTWWLRQRASFEAREVREELENEKLRNKYETLSRHANDIILVSASDGHMLDVNERAVEAYGYSRQGLLSMSIEKLVPDDRQADFAGNFAQVRKAGFHIFETTHTTRDGHRFPVEISTRTMVMDDDTVFLSVIRDITERKQAMESLRTYAAEIENQNRKMDAIFTSTPEHVWLFDRELRCVFASKAALSILSIPLPDIMGKTWRELKFPGDALLRIETDLQRTLEGGTPVKGHTPLTTPEGQRHFEYIIFPVRGEGGSIAGAGATLHDITERRQAEERIQYLAHYDTLTGLPNRVMLDDYINAAISGAMQQDRQAAILLLDLDRFKTINDSLGHVLGDTLLQAVAGRIKETVRRKDIVSRMGGDEFIILAPGLRNAAEAAHLAQKIVESMAHPFMLGDNRITTSPSIGISVYPDDGIDPETLIRNADTAMYQAKALGRNNFQFFTQQMTARAQELMSLDIGLRQAFENKEFLLHYQPQVLAENGRIVGAEALVRWMSPGKGLIPPGKFIPVAEETGLIIPLGEWILRTACETAAAWRREGLPPITMAVNLSAVQFRSQSLPAAIDNILRETGLPPEMLELELTEGIIMSDAEGTIEKLKFFKNMGIKLSIDDFGTGYSSLSYLRRFPIDKLKIDQSFVRDLMTDAGDAAITNSIIALAKGLGLRVIAEGVETAEQLDYLKAHGCDEIQGFYFSKPLPAADFRTRLTG